MVPTKSYKGLLLVAITAGLGFQISEDFSYILSDLPDGFSYTISGILGRSIGVVSSHWLYTSFFAMGLILIWRSCRKIIDQKYCLTGFLYACGAFAAHFAWNSPLRNLESDFPGLQAFLFQLIFSSSLCFINCYLGLMKKIAIVKALKPFHFYGKVFDKSNHSLRIGWSLNC